MFSGIAKMATASPIPAGITKDQVRFFNQRYDLFFVFFWYLVNLKSQIFDLLSQWSF